jgi:hypothetical protein
MWLNWGGDELSSLCRDWAALRADTVGDDSSWNMEDCSCAPSATCRHVRPRREVLQLGRCRCPAPLGLHGPLRSSSRCVTPTAYPCHRLSAVTDIMILSGILSMHCKLCVYWHACVMCTPYMCLYWRLSQATWVYMHIFQLYLFRAFWFM